MEKMIFLLGGYDLEMLTIRNLLEENKKEFCDYQLQWDNAKPEKYEDIFLECGNKDDIIIYGIELSESSFTSQYRNYIRLDHHNDLNNAPAVILQVVELLKIPLTRYLQLVAINDSEYIPGMIEFGATKKEIEEIRYQDRKAQGVTEKDELLAEEAIKNGLEEIAALTIVKSSTSRFATICDRLFPFKKLLIYTEDEWIYYGIGVEHIIHLYVDKLPKNEFFYGGGIHGFAGVSKGAFTSECIVEMKKQIIEEILKY